MRLRTDVLLSAFSCWGCARAGQAPHAPPIAVNQAGLDERLLLVAPEPEYEAAEAEAEGEGGEAPGDRAAVEEVAEPVPTDSEHPGSEHPEKPDPESSSRRVAFRRSGETAQALESTTREPDAALDPERDPRRSRFLAREQDRLRRADQQ